MDLRPPLVLVGAKCASREDATRAVIMFFQMFFQRRRDAARTVTLPVTPSPRPATP